MNDVAVELVTIAHASQRERPILSLILCSRNDQYLGNSRWRLETALNYVGERVGLLGRGGDVEVLVTDWGSEVPLREVAALRPAAAKIVSFVWVPPALAQELQGDSPFPEVLALNAAARRATGQYIGRIDQDTLVGVRFLRRIFEWVEGPRSLGVRLETALLFANRRSIPYRFAVRCPSFSAVENFVHRFGRLLRVETSRSPEPFYWSDVGIWLLHRNLWSECGGYDERMIFMNDMDIEMAARLMAKYPMIDLGRLVGWDFYHLDHYHPRGSRSSSTHRMVNAQNPRDSRGFNPNGDRWGLAAYSLEVISQPASERSARKTRRRARAEFAIFVFWVVSTGAWTVLDRLLYPAWRRRWTHRAQVVWATVHEQPISWWPTLIRKLWLDRPSARAR